MKKLFLSLAITLTVGAVSAGNLVGFKHLVSSTTQQDNKQGKPKGHDCSKHEKGHCNRMKNDSTHHDCSKHDKAKCCKDKKDAGKHDCKGREKAKCCKPKKDSVGVK